MNKTKISQLNEFGQSAWLDSISRSLIASGKLEELIKMGAKGVTSNPTIFDKAVKSGSDYDEEIQALHAQGKSISEIYDDLTVRDIQEAADKFTAVYEKTEKLDGYVSLEVDPKLAYETEKTIEEARRLRKEVKRANLMVKVPSTREGISAIEELVAEGVNINATLIFSVSQYAETAQAYARGIKRFIRDKGSAKDVRSVASVFVSRIDTVCDEMLCEKSTQNLKGAAAVANSALIYEKFREIFSSNDFKVLAIQGANIQRPLWASTSTKNPSYSDIKYVTELMGKDTVNTMPRATFEAFLDHGSIVESLPGSALEARNFFNELKSAGIDINSVCEGLLRDGVEAFEKSFDSLLCSIEEKASKLCGA